MAEKKFLDWKLTDIIEWCQANDQVDWLKAESKKTVKHKIYPKVATVSKKGKKSWKYDKTQQPTIEEVPISFVELKTNFINTFIETTPKEKKLSMYEIIANL